MIRVDYKAQVDCSKINENFTLIILTYRAGALTLFPNTSFIEIASVSQTFEHKSLQAIIGFKMIPIMI